MKILVNLKHLGKRRNSIEAMEFYLASKPSTVEDLIIETVKSCVHDYNERKENSELLTNLTKEQIETKSLAGKVSFGVNYSDSTSNPDLEQATNNAIQSFEDGIYRIFLDDKELTNLKSPITVTEKSVFTFIRMTMLAGRMW